MKKLLSIILILLIPNISFGAIAFDAAANGDYTYTGGSVTFAHTMGTGANNILLVGASYGNSTISATYNGVSMTKLSVTRAYDTTSTYVTLFYLVGAATGTHNVVVTGAGGDFVTACSASYTGVSSTSPINVQSAGNASNSISAQSAPWNFQATSTVDGTWMVAQMASYGGNPTNAGTNTTRRSQEPVLRNCGMFDSNSAKTPAGATTLQITDWPGSRDAFASAAILTPFVATPTGLSTVGFLNGIDWSTLGFWNGVDLSTIISLNGML